MAKGASGYTLKRKSKRSKTTTKAKASGLDWGNILEGILAGGAGYSLRSLQDWLASKGLPSGPTLGPTPTPPTTPTKIKVPGPLGTILPGILPSVFEQNIYEFVTPQWIESLPNTLEAVAADIARGEVSPWDIPGG